MSNMPNNITREEALQIAAIAAQNCAQDAQKFNMLFDSMRTKLLQVINPDPGPAVPQSTAPLDNLQQAYQVATSLKVGTAVGAKPADEPSPAKSVATASPEAMRRVALFKQLGSIGLDVQTVNKLTQANITTVATLITHSHASLQAAGLTPAEIAAVDTAVSKANLTLGMQPTHIAQWLHGQTSAAVQNAQQAAGVAAQPTKENPSS